MSYGQPCRRTTAGPFAGPASAYPTFSRPASICFSDANDVFVPGVIFGTCTDCASAELIETSGAAANVIAAFRRKRRRFCPRCSPRCSLTSSDILNDLIDEYLQSDQPSRK